MKEMLPLIDPVQDRPETLRKSFPLVSQFFYTGEDLNPWTCENCITIPQIKVINKMIKDNTKVSVQPPECCRKCGMSFFS